MAEPGLEALRRLEDMLGIELLAGEWVQAAAGQADQPLGEAAKTWAAASPAISALKEPSADILAPVVKSSVIFDLLS